MDRDHMDKTHDTTSTCVGGVVVVPVVGVSRQSMLCSPIEKFHPVYHFTFVYALLLLYGVLSYYSTIPSF